jgi:aspartyl-tRNA(Asn)/glutamyl-tRNA(Gln) amidotransferase subunit C
MEHVTEQDIDHYASLSQFQLNDDTRKRFTKEINQILDFVQILQKVDTESIAPTRHGTDRVNVFRDDVIQDPLPHAEVFKNSPLDDGVFFLVPRIIEGEDNS